MGLKNMFRKSKDKEAVRTYNGKAFILSGENDFEKIMDVLCRRFNIDNSGEGNTMTIHNNDIEISVQVLTEEMGEDAAKFISGQVNGICGHFYGVETEHTDIKTNLLYAVGRSKSMIFVNYSFLDDGKFDKKSFIEETFATVLNELLAVMLIIGKDAEDGVYCQSQDDDKVMDLILSDKGRSDLEHYLPEDVFTMTSENNTINDEQIDRRKRSHKSFKEKYIYVPAWYPVIESEEEAKCRTAEEIAERAVALLIVSLYSECRLSEKMGYEEAYNFVKDIIEQYDADKMFSPKEKAYLNNPDSTEQEQIQFCWQYENLFVMEWALGLVDGMDKLDYPDHICDVPLTVQILNECSSFEEILKKAQRKSNELLLDECDLIFCLDWACVDTRVHKLPAPAGLDSGVVVERHKALNWLIGADENADWDDVGTDT